MLSKQDIYDIYEQGPEAVADLIMQLLNQNEQLAKHMAELEERLSKNSQNSDKPPSSDGFKKRVRKPKRIRNKDKRQSGGQLGHPGKTLRMSDQVDEIVRHEPVHCKSCGQDLANQTGEVGRKKQVIDIPPPRVIRTEHQSIVKRCPCCGDHSSGKLPEHLKGNVQYGHRLRALVNYLMAYQLLPYERTSELVEAIYGISPSTGTLHQMLQDGYINLEEAEKAIRQAIIQSKVAHFDETGHRVGSKTRWLHVAATRMLTFYYSHTARGAKAHRAGGVLPVFKGIAVHDFYSSYLKIECQHALCNAHIIRELRAVLERDSSQLWGKSLIRLLVTAKKMVALASQNGKSALSPVALKAIHTKYKTLLDQASRLNPKAKSSGKKGRVKQTKTRNLIDRMAKHQADILRYVADFKVPFDNNLAERDLRMVKVQQKISNCFRSELGADMFCRIRGYISTLLKQEYDVLPILTQVMQGNVLIPVPAE
ncbi:MAG: IS66 family transposase [Chloroflexota bacterium]